jgi:Trypsin.
VKALCYIPTIAKQRDPFAKPGKITLGTGINAGNKYGSDGIFQVDRIEAKDETKKAMLKKVHQDRDAPLFTPYDFVLLHLTTAVNTHPPMALADASINKQSLKGRSAYELGFRLYDAGSEGKTYDGTLLQGQQTFLSDGDFTRKALSILEANHASEEDTQRAINSFEKNAQIFLGFTSGKSQSGNCQRPANGDSGGPLVYQNKDGNWVIIGLVSSGILSNEDPDCEIAFSYTNLLNPEIQKYIKGYLGENASNT